MSINKTNLAKITVLTAGLASSWLLTSLSASSVTAQEPELQIGIVQRFGQQAQDKLTISSTDGDSLNLTVVGGDGQPQTVQTNQLTLEVAAKPLNKPILEERLVLSDHATFETAENSANEWRKLGIEVEITQPDRWQVWAKRDVYQTPLLRRWLLQSLQQQGDTTAYLETAMVNQEKQVAVTVNGFRYERKDLEISSGKDLLRVKVGNETTSNLYPGSLKIQPNSYGTFTLVNEVPLESYLRGVVPYEIGTGAPDNAIKSQTIIARTYALRNLRRFKADNYELSADTHCQVYKGLTGAAANTDSAIAATSGLVLTYNNELVDALYSSTTGGITAPFSDIWNGSERPYLQAVIDAPNQVWDLSAHSLADETAFRQFIAMQDGFNETGRSVFRWQKQRNVTDLSKDLQKYLQRIKHPLANFSKINTMEIIKRSQSGRILTLKVNTDKGDVLLYKTEVRSAFEPPSSTLFYLEPVYDPNKTLIAYNFVGGGFGHGVGLSQYGSYNLAKLGWTADKILAFYYPGTTIQPLSQNITFWKDVR